MIFQRRTDHPRYSEILPAWRGETVVLLGGGPSLTQDQVELVRVEHEARRVRCIAINDAYLLAPWADVLYFADAHWWHWQTEGIEKSALRLTAAQVSERFAAFAGEKCSISFSEPNIPDKRVHIMQNAHGSLHGEGLSLDPKKIVTGRHGGFQALNVAVLAGARRVLLLGFDGRTAKADGRSHWFGEHPRPTPHAVYEAIRRSFSAAERALVDARVEVLNCSPGSAIDSFTKTTLEVALKSGCEAEAG